MTGCILTHKAVGDADIGIDLRRHSFSDVQFQEGDSSPVILEHLHLKYHIVKLISKGQVDQLNTFPARSEDTCTE